MKFLHYQAWDQGCRPGPRQGRHPWSPDWYLGVGAHQASAKLLCVCPLEVDVSRVPHSLATSSLQLEPPRALPFMGRAGAGSQVCTERV